MHDLVRSRFSVPCPSDRSKVPCCIASPLQLRWSSLRVTFELEEENCRYLRVGAAAVGARVLQATGGAGGALVAPPGAKDVGRGGERLGRGRVGRGHPLAGLRAASLACAFIWRGSLQVEMKARDREGKGKK